MIQIIGIVFLTTAVLAQDEGWLQMADYQTWSNFNGQVYFIGDKNLNFFKAQQFCNYHGMNLATMETEEQKANIQEMVQQQAETGINQFWLAGTCMADDINWYWMGTGKFVEPFVWDGNQYEDYNDNKCLMINNDYEVYSENCYNEMPFICQVRQPSECGRQ